MEDITEIDFSFFAHLIVLVLIQSLDLGCIVWSNLFLL
jgi:hypothetical protein